MSEQEIVTVDVIDRMDNDKRSKLNARVMTADEAAERLIGPEKAVYPSFLDFQVAQMKLEQKVLESKNEILANRLRQVAALKDDLDRLRAAFQIVYDQLNSFTSGLHGLSSTESIAEE